MLTVAEGAESQSAPTAEDPLALAMARITARLQSTGRLSCGFVLFNQAQRNLDLEISNQKVQDQAQLWSRVLASHVAPWFDDAIQLAPIITQRHASYFLAQGRVISDDSSTWLLISHD
jgi:hypothetical protein